MPRSLSWVSTPYVCRSLGIAAVCVLSTASAALALDRTSQDEPFVRITFLDVGQGDAVAVQAPEGQVLLIDAGRSEPEALREMGVVELDLVVATHPHADHIGGMLRVLEDFPVRFYMDNGRPHTTQTYQAVLETLLLRPDVTYLSADARTINLGSVQLRVLPPPPTEQEELNNLSVGLVLSFGEFRAFFSGDSETEELTYFLREGVVPDVTLLKAPHHGSDNGYTLEFLRVARPEVVVISVGENAYGHPGPAAVDAYEAVSDEVFRTDIHGAVTILGYRDGRYEVLSGVRGRF